MTQKTSEKILFKTLKDEDKYMIEFNRKMCIQTLHQFLKKSKEETTFILTKSLVEAMNRHDENSLDEDKIDESYREKQISLLHLSIEDYFKQGQ